jgi:hypothetical protein
MTSMLKSITLNIGWSQIQIDVGNRTKLSIYEAGHYNSMSDKRSLHTLTAQGQESLVITFGYFSEAEPRDRKADR